MSDEGDWLADFLANLMTDVRNGWATERDCIKFAAHIRHHIAQDHRSDEDAYELYWASLTEEERKSEGRAMADYASEADY